MNIIVRHGRGMGNGVRGEAVVDNTIIIVAIREVQSSSSPVSQGVTGLHCPDS